MLGTTNASTCVSNPSSMATMPQRMNIFHCADWIGAASSAAPISISRAAESCSLILIASDSARASEFDACTKVQRSQPSDRSEEHTSEIQSLMRISYAVLFLNKKKHIP